jgi:hypothetical protein
LCVLIPFIKHQVGNTELLSWSSWSDISLRHNKVYRLSVHNIARPQVLTLIMCSRDSFLNLSRWLADAKALASPHLVTVLVGNKSDRDEEREVEWAEASRWAAENGA